MDHIVREGVGRIAIGLVTLWVCVWGYVGWRAYGLRESAASYVASLPPGTAVPADISAVLEASTEWLRISVVLGVILPLGFFAAARLYSRLNRARADR